MHPWAPYGFRPKVVSISGPNWSKVNYPHLPDFCTFITPQLSVQRPLKKCLKFHYSMNLYGGKYTTFFKGLCMHHSKYLELSCALNVHSWYQGIVGWTWYGHVYVWYTLGLSPLRKTVIQWGQCQALVSDDNDKPQATSGDSSNKTTSSCSAPE